jgi:hypothetical protein
MRAGLARVAKRIASIALLTKSAFARHEDVWIVHEQPERIDFEPACARCLQTATGTRRETSPSGATTILVPYCQACLDAFGKRNVEHLAWVLACTLLGIAGSVFFPLIPWLSEWTVVSAALCFASVPWVLGRLWLRYADLPLSRRSAAYPGTQGLVCLNERWAARLAERLGSSVSREQVRARMAAGWSVAGLVIAAVVTPLLYDTFHCETRILNLTEEDLVITVDGRHLAIIKPTTQENPLAGKIVRIAMGPRQLQARRNDGTLVHAGSVRISAGQMYLYAPAHPSDTCFWIERASLGRTRAASLVREYLPGHEDFWRMPIAIDTWFLPALRSESDSFTGGVVTSLRQGSCETPRTDSRGGAVRF